MWPTSPPWLLFSPGRRCSGPLRGPDTAAHTARCKRHARNACAIRPQRQVFSHTRIASIMPRCAEPVGSDHTHLLAMRQGLRKKMERRNGKKQQAGSFLRSVKKHRRGCFLRSRTEYRGGMTEATPPPPSPLGDTSPSGEGLFVAFGVMALARWSAMKG